MKYREVLKPFVLDGIQYQVGQYILESLILDTGYSINESLEDKVSTSSFDLILG